jgi:hypothetical protein
MKAPLMVRIGGLALIGGAVANADQQSVIGSIFDGLNVYLGNYLGEFLGELSFSTFLLLSSWVLLRSHATRPWIAGVGLLTGAAGLVGMFRNLTPAVGPVASLKQLLVTRGNDPARYCLLSVPHG